MLRLSDFDLQTPRTLAEAHAILRDGDGVSLIAGGTDMIPKMKRGQFEPRTLVALAGIDELARLERQEQELYVGAGTTLRTLEMWSGIDDFAAFAQAVRVVATPIIRRMATIGGNLLQDTRCRFIDRTDFWREAIGHCMKKGADECRVAPGGHGCYASFCSDLAPALAVLDASVRAVGSAERKIPLADLYESDGMAHLRLNREIVTAIVVPLVPGRTSTYKKVRIREGFDFPEVGVAASVDTGDDACRVRIALTGVDSGLVTASDTISRDQIPDLVQSVYASVKPMDTMFSPPAYRRKVARKLLTQALDELFAAR